jgi:mevalonate kinase
MSAVMGFVRSVVGEIRSWMPVAMKVTGAAATGTIVLSPEPITKYVSALVAVSLAAAEGAHTKLRDEELKEVVDELLELAKQLGDIPRAVEFIIAQENEEGRTWAGTTYGLSTNVWAVMAELITMRFNRLEDLERSNQELVDSFAREVLRRLGEREVTVERTPVALQVNEQITSATIVERDGLADEMERFFSDCTQIASAPGSVFICGEKANVRGAPAVMCRVPRRVYVGLIPDPQGDGLRPIATKVVRIGHNARPGHAPKNDPSSTTRLVPGSAYEILSSTIRDRYRTTPKYRVRVWTEWEGESGLGWSAALATALSCALLSSLRSDFSVDWENPQQTDNGVECFALAWLFESVLHGGRAGGTSVAASHCRTLLPIIFRDDCIGGTPRLWRLIGDTDAGDVPTEPEFMLDPTEQIRRFMEHATGGDWQLEVLGQRLEGDESDKWNRLIHDVNLMVIDTGTKGSTGAASASEYSDQDLRRNLTPIIDAIRGRAESEVVDIVRAALGAVPNEEGRLSECVSEAFWAELEELLRRGHPDGLYASIASSMRSLVDACSRPEANGSEIRGLWSAIMERVSRTRGLLTAWGTTFPAADFLVASIYRICGNAYTCVGELEQGPVVAGKTSGKGTAGNVLLLYRRDSDRRERVYEALDWAAMAPVTDKRAPYLVLYDAATDGPEPGGPQIVRRSLEEPLSFTAGG